MAETAALYKSREPWMLLVSQSSRKVDRFQYSDDPSNSETPRISTSPVTSVEAACLSEETTRAKDRSPTPYRRLSQPVPRSTQMPFRRATVARLSSGRMVIPATPGAFRRKADNQAATAVLSKSQAKIRSAFQDG